VRRQSLNPTKGSNHYFIADESACRIIRELLQIAAASGEVYLTPFCQYLRYLFH
jgi:hypothetical protein